MVEDDKLLEIEEEEEEIGKRGIKSGPGITETGREEEIETGTHEKKGARAPRRGIKTVKVKAEPGWEDQWDETYEAVIEPLIRQNADIDIEVSIKGSSEEGMDKSKIEHEIEENLTQRDIEHEIEYED